MVFQNYNIFKNKTVIENVMLPMTSVQKIEKEIAKEKGLTMADVAKRMNMSQSGLSMALNRNLTLDVLSRIADALEVEIPDLFERKKEEENTIICPKCGSKFKLIE